MKQKQRGIHELYDADPVAADAELWGRQTDPLTRRGFLTKGGLVAMSAAVGASIPFAHLMPGGLIPAALAQSDAPFEIPGKDGLVHISQISHERVERVSDKLAEGDVIRVKVLEVDRQGRIRLSMRNIED